MKILNINPRDIEQIKPRFSGINQRIMDIRFCIFRPIKYWLPVAPAGDNRCHASVREFRISGEADHMPDGHNIKILRQKLDTGTLYRETN